MAIPTTQKECTTRRIASLIIGLWDKVKDAFLLKTSRGSANGVASLDANGKVPSSQLPKIGTSGILNDAITAALVKDGETLPVNISGKSNEAYTIEFNATLSQKWVRLGSILARPSSDASFSMLIYSGMDISGNASVLGHLSASNRGNDPSIKFTYLAGGNVSGLEFGYVKDSSTSEITVYMKRLAYSGKMRLAFLVKSHYNATIDISELESAPSGTFVKGDTLVSVTCDYKTAVGDEHTPIYFGSDNKLKPCTGIPVIEHVTTIPVNPTVGTIYAL